MKMSWLYGRNSLVLRHVLIWSIVLFLPAILRYNYDDRLRHDPLSAGFMRLELITGVFWILAFYFNALVLTPRFIYRKQHLRYFASLLVLFLGIMFVHGRFFHWLIPLRPYNFAISILINLPAFVVAIAVSLAFKLLYDKSQDEQREKEKRAETLLSEVSFLRSQISPHFVFNILNNITAMARLKSDALEPTIIKLSSLLRYMVYDASMEKVSLQTEIEYLQSYIDLQKQRFGSKVIVVCDMTTVVGNQEIEPMLLIPFVENAFKHGMGMIRNPEIRVELTITAKRLRFRVSNRYNPGDGEVRDKTSGIGLANVKRRLALLYEKDHDLVVEKSDDWFIVTLHLNLHA